MRKRNLSKNAAYEKTRFLHTHVGNSMQSLFTALPLPRRNECQFRLFWATANFPPQLYRKWTEHIHMNWTCTCRCNSHEVCKNNQINDCQRNTKFSMKKKFNFFPGPSSNSPPRLTQLPRFSRNSGNPVFTHYNIVPIHSVTTELRGLSNVTQTI